ncbi:MAG TPA: hypothetical protein VFR87_04475 [Nocardioidaceae bacterium]|nr:hypothetical protein [Nocardioidaceae bacterium]
MPWVESTEDWRQVPRSLVKTLLVIVVAGVAIGYAVGLLLARGFDTLDVENVGRQFSGQDAELPAGADSLHP